MTGLQKLEHAHLRVEDLDAAIEFYTDVMGLSELTRESGVVYLGTGYDDNYDLAVEDGGTGLVHFAIRVPDDAELERLEHRLEEHGVEYERRDGTEPSQVQGVRFQLPNGVDMEMVTVDNSTYVHPSRHSPERPSVTPLGLDHVNLMAADVEETITFVVETVGLDLSEVRNFMDGSADGWELAFARYGDTHHDVAATYGPNPDQTLHHLGWEMRDISHMRSLVDALAVAGHQLEVGMSRHSIGGNLFCYFLSPGGNRFELNAEMSTLDATTDPVFHDEQTRSSAFSSWGGVAIPETWSDGS